MAEASVSLAHDQFKCPVCLELLKDPVTAPCGHSFCKVCINGCWDLEDQRRVYSCPQCREMFTPRPVLRRNNMLAEVVEQLKKTEVQPDSAAHCYAGAAEVECDFCTGTELKAVKSCLMCRVSLCETHLQPHYQLPALKSHKLVQASTKLQEKICPKHQELLKIYCRTDQQFICTLCVMDKHKLHDTVSAVAEREEKQSELKNVQTQYKQRLQEKQKKLEEVKQAVITIKRSAQSAVDNSERIFTELIGQLEKKRSEATELIRDQEKAELSRAERVLEQLEQEIADLKRRDAELQQLSHTEDHIHFLQSFQSLCVSSGSQLSSSIYIHQRPSFDGVSKSLTALKERLEQFCREDFNKMPAPAAATHISLPVGPKSRKEFLTYYCRLTLDPKTAHRKLGLSEKNKVVTHSKREHFYFDHPERFELWCTQVLCEQSVCGRCYWEVEWSTEKCVDIAVSYKGISRKGGANECGFGFNNHSWSLYCSSSPYFCHNSISTELSSSPCSRIGVYVDHSAGTLSFYNVSDKMSLLHRVHTTFTQPLYPGFGLDLGSCVRLCDHK